jgi:competence protein ComGC
MSFLLELWQFIKARKKFWLLPLIIVLVIVGGMLVLAKGSVVAPFIYTIF